MTPAVNVGNSEVGGRLCHRRPQFSARLLRLTAEKPLRGQVSEVERGRFRALATSCCVEFAARADFHAGFSIAREKSELPETEPNHRRCRVIDARR
jgi:hypothetical protein